MIKSPSSQFPVVWTVGHTTDPAIAPERFVSAIVPGAVQLDWAHAEGWPDYWIGENHLAYGWMEDAHWIYQTHLIKPETTPGERLVLVCGGVDYACTVRLDGSIVHQQEGMFSPFTVDLTEATNGALLEIVVAPAPPQNTVIFVNLNLVLYPNAQVVQFVQRYETDGEVEVLFRSEANTVQLAQFYKKAVEARGWSTKKAKIKNDNVKLEFRKGSDRLTLEIDREGGMYRLTIQD